MTRSYCRFTGLQQCCSTSAKCIFLLEISRGLSDSVLFQMSDMQEHEWLAHSYSHVYFFLSCQLIYFCRQLQEAFSMHRSVWYTCGDKKRFFRGCLQGSKSVLMQLEKRPLTSHSNDPWSIFVKFTEVTIDNYDSKWKKCCSVTLFDFEPSSFCLSKCNYSVNSSTSVQKVKSTFPKH